MRKSTLFIVGALMASSLAGQTTTTDLWSYGQASNWTFASGKSELVTTPTAVTAGGDSYFAGVFNQDFSFAGEDFRPFGTNAYIKKYDKSGEEDWAVILEGAATITQMKTAENGNVFVAGTLADVVIVNSTDGKGMEIAGYEINGAFGTAQSASFVAEYTSEGVLIDAVSFVSKDLTALNGTPYEYVDGDVFFQINNLEIVNNQAYVSALFTGQFDEGAVDVSSSYYNFFDFIFGYSKAGLIMTLGSDLMPASLVASVVDSDPVILEKQTVLTDISFGVTDGTLTGVIIATDSREIKVGNSTIPFSMSNDGNGNLGYGHLVFTYDISSSSLLDDELFETVTSASNVDIQIQNITSEGGNIYLSGHFSGTSAFDSGVKATSKADLFVASLNQSSLATQWVSASGINEGDQNLDSERLVDVVINDGNAYLYGYTYTTSSKVMNMPALLQVSLDNGAKTVSQQGDFVTGAAINGTMFAKSETTIDEGKVSNLYSLATVVSTSIEGVKGDKVATIYPTMTSDIVNFSTVVDVEVYDLTGSLVHAAKQVESINIAHLMGGSYLVKVTTKEGQNVVKVIKQ